MGPSNIGEWPLKSVCGTYRENLAIVSFFLKWATLNITGVLWSLDL